MALDIIARGLALGMSGDVDEAKAKAEQAINKATELTGEVNEIKTTLENKEDAFITDNTVRLYKNQHQTIEPGMQVSHVYFNTDINPTAEELNAIIDGSPLTPIFGAPYAAIMYMDIHGEATGVMCVNLYGSPMIMFGGSGVYTPEAGWQLDAIELYNDMLAQHGPATIIGTIQGIDVAPYHQDLWKSFISTVPFPHTDDIRLGINPDVVALKSDLITCDPGEELIIEL